jgi:hypothetical protein
MILTTTAFKHFIVTMWLENHKFYREPCLTDLIPEIFGLVFFNKSQIPPDGSETVNLYFCRQSNR